MICRIGKNEVAFLENRAYQADVGGITGGKVQSGVRSDKAGKIGFEPIPAFMISGEQARAGRAEAVVFFQRCDDRSSETRMRRKTEIVVRAELDSGRVCQTA